MQNERAQRGLKKLLEINPGAEEDLLPRLKEISPDMARYLVEFPFGDIYSRPGLSLRDREIATIAALTTHGYAGPQLKSHIRGGLNAGLTEGEILEILIQMAVYAGFPASLNALYCAQEVFEERVSLQRDRQEGGR